MNKEIRSNEHAFCSKCLKAPDYMQSIPSFILYLNKICSELQESNGNVEYRKQFQIR